MDYRRLNALIKRDKYPISLIEEILAKVQGSKYLSRLNIIAAFNKLRIHSNNEDLIIFIISFGAFKYLILFFNLTNGFTSFQYYINDVLFKYFHDFC
jgi:hypothetical protein